MNFKAQEDYRKKLVDWYVKNEFLKEQISALEKIESIPILSISVFLLKTQLIEFELKQLITSLDLHLNLSLGSSFIKRKIRTPKELDEKKMTLGILRNELDHYEGVLLYDIKEDLTILVGLRNKFVHHLFNPGTIEAFELNSKKGIKTASKTIIEIEKIKRKIKT